MNNCKSLFVLVLLLTFLSCNQTETDLSTNGLEDSQSLSAEKEVGAAVDTLLSAMVNPEKTLLQRITADDLTYGHSTGLIEEKGEFIENLTQGEFNFLSIDVSDQSIYISGKTAIVRHILSAEASDSGDPVDVRIGIVLVYQKEDGRWKLLARQAFKY